MIDVLADTGFPVNTCCRVLGVSRQGYYRYKRRPASATQLRREWLTGLINEVHIVHAAPTATAGCTPNSPLVWA